MKKKGFILLEKAGHEAGGDRLAKLRKAKSRCQNRPLQILESVMAFTLLEVMVSMIILALLASGLFSVLISKRYLASRSRQRLTAIEIARREIENNRQFISADVWNQTYPANPLDPNMGWSAWNNTNLPYLFRYKVENVAGADYRKMTVEVRWNETRM